MCFDRQRFLHGIIQEIMQIIRTLALTAERTFSIDLVTDFHRFSIKYSDARILHFVKENEIAFHFVYIELKAVEFYCAELKVINHFFQEIKIKLIAI